MNFEFDPLLQSTLDSSTGMRPRADFMAQTWPILPPGKRVETIFDSTVELFNSDLPTRYEVTAHYIDGQGHCCHDEPLTLDIGVYRGRAYVGSKTLTQLTEAVESIATTFKGMAEDRAAVDE